MNIDYARNAERLAASRTQEYSSGHRMYELITAAYNRAIALALIVVLAPLWLAIAVLIKLSSPGPVLFCMPIVGRRGATFTYYKFRTMKIGQDDSEHREWIRAFVRDDQPYSRDSAGSAVFKVVDDPRVTRVGRWLRNASLDELPQLINILRGEMNLVGPRPPIAYEYGLYRPHERLRLAVKPGITGLYQVQKRGRASFSQMLALDLEYVQRRSLWLDLWIMLRTPQAMLQGEVSRS
ncbi:MAG: sugar transferase [Chloroflexi bacterium]|nr:sugar transferase [Chloroflexota bacterium]